MEEQLIPLWSLPQANSRKLKYEVLPVEFVLLGLIIKRIRKVAIYANREIFRIVVTKILAQNAMSVDRIRKRMKNYEWFVVLSYNYHLLRHKGVVALSRFID